MKSETKPAMVLEETAPPMGEEHSCVEAVLETHRAYKYPAEFQTWPEEFALKTLGWLFPHFAKEPLRDANAVRRELESLRVCLRDALSHLRNPVIEDVEGKSKAFVAGLPETLQILTEDAAAMYEFDPAAENIDQIIFAYPGFFAIAVQRVAHALYELQVPLFPRMLTEYAHRQTGVDIHPGATIGREFCIDHGTGIVIGETALIGDRVKMYQGVTLGAYHVHKSLAGAKRHPTIEDDVVIYAHATILGGGTVVGKASVVGGNSWVTQSIPAHSVVSRRSNVRTMHTDIDQVIDFNI